MLEKTISCVMCTYGRYTSVCRSVSFFIDQDYKNKELIIFNTAPVEMSIDPKFYNIKVINQQSKSDGSDFRSIGEVRSEAMKHISGELYACWDDDDFFIPFHLSQCCNHLVKSGKKAWKPKKSLWSNNAGVTFEEVENNMEASILVEKEHVFFEPKTGDEHIGWLSKLRDEKQIDECEYVPPSYCYVWGDPKSPHKQSGHIDDPNNFNNHKKNSLDFGEQIIPADVKAFYRNIYKFTHDQRMIPFLV